MKSNRRNAGYVAPAWQKCILALVFSALAWAQGVTGVISGIVSDPSKSPVEGASVKITNTDTGVTVWSGKTNAAGVYRAPDLPAGHYEINVSAAGFKTQQISKLELVIDQRADIPVTMQLGQVAETVTVEGETAGQLAVDTGSLGTIATPSQLEDLPLPSRNIYNLLALSPGVSSGGDISSQGGISSSQLSINGSRTVNNEFLIDGVSVITGSTGGPQTLPPVDSIQEFKVLAASYSAEYGRTAGAMVTIITKSGSNQYHGALYAFYRNEDLDANNYFSNVINKRRPEDRYNLFGGAFGGPVLIPHVYNGKNKTFFFLNYEGLRQASPYSNISSIPYGAYAQGNFSASPTVVDSPTGKAPFPGNSIPTSLINPAALKILGLVPGPNSPGTFNATDNLSTNNYVSIGSSHPNNNTGVFRIDENVSSSLRLFGSFTHFNNFSPTQPVFPGSVLDSATGNSVTTGYESTFGLTKTWSPTFISEFRMGFFRNNSEYRPPSDGINDEQTLGIGTQYGIAAPEINISAYSMLGTNTNTQRTQIDNNFQYYLNNSKSLGNHLVQFGAQLRKNQFDDLNPTGDVNGIYTFNGSITSPKNSSGDGIQALADFLLGDIQTSSYSLPQPLIGRRNYNFALYAQDDWKIRPNLTLNIGLRWEYEAPMTTANNDYSRVDPTTGQVLFAGKNGVSNSLNLAGNKLNFGPRLGLAYSVNPKTVIRAGGGIFYIGIFSDVGGQVLFPGYTVIQSFPAQGTGIPQPFSLSQGMPSVVTNNPSNPQANIAQFGTAANPLTLTDYDGFTQAKPLPYVETWNFGIQRQIMPGTILDVNYVGTHGVNLAINLPTNTVPYNVAIDTALGLANNSTTTNQARPYPGIGSFNSLNFEGNSSYDALQVSVRHQVGTNLAFIVNYTRSKSIDDASGLFSFSQPSGLNLGQFPQQFLSLNRGLSEFDRPNDFTMAIMYRTKGNKWIRNFEINPMLVAHNGLPLYIGQTNENPAQTGSNQQRPFDIIPSTSLYTAEVPNGTGVQYLLPDTAANFPLIPAGPLYSGSGSARVQVLPVDIGSLGRDVVRSPGQLDLNFVVARVFPIRERLKFTIRLEAYNALNHTNFNAPASSTLTLTQNSQGYPTWNSATYGIITAAGQARYLQMAVRFNF
ncbi:MAG TPA: TonB-dependent receptor [Verrucomicrobiae bacterium]|nr:TonB-dependent receptor [Verrucomicrobiae bacterium]